MSDIEIMVAKLQMLAAKPNLSAAENAEVQALMQNLKGLGMSNGEISKASHGRWSESTVKGYCTGISSTSPSPWEDAVALLTDLIASNISLDDVKTILGVKHTLAAKNLTTEDVIGFLETVAAAGLVPAKLVSEVKGLKQAGLSLQAAVGATALKEQMEAGGLTLEVLPELVKIAQQYGPVQKVLEAFSVFASLSALQAEINSAQQKLEKTQTAQATAGKQLKQTEAKNQTAQAAADKQLKQAEAKIQELQSLIDAYHNFRERGFTDKMLDDLTSLADNHGGLKKVIEEVKKYASLEDIKSELTTAKSELADYESKISQATTKYGHMTSAIAMCETLITDYKYGLDAIGTILGLAKKFGEPIAVLKAVETWGNLASLKKKVDELGSTAAERQELLAGLEAQFKEAQTKLDGLYAVVAEVADKTGRLVGECKASEQLQLLLTIIQSPEQAAFGEHGQVLLMVAISLRRWVKAHTKDFRNSTDPIDAGLKRLIEEMGGTVQ